MQFFNLLYTYFDLSINENVKINGAKYKETKNFGKRNRKQLSAYRNRAWGQ